MFLGTFLVLLVTIASWLWWRLALSQQRNAELCAELHKLRGKLKALR